VTMVEIERGGADAALRRPGALRHRFDGAPHGQNRK
jgi:hypothetical protein